MICVGDEEKLEYNSKIVTLLPCKQVTHLQSLVVGIHKKLKIHCQHNFNFRLCWWNMSYKRAIKPFVCSQYDGYFNKACQSR